MRCRLVEVEINDRVILPPFGNDSGGRTLQRESSRRVLAIEKHADHVVLTIDGQAPKVLSRDLEVVVFPDVVYEPAGAAAVKKKPHVVDRPVGYRRPRWPRRH